MTYFEVIPSPHSPAVEPTYTTAVTDHYGNRHESNPYMPYASRDHALDNLFERYAWPGGYDLAYVGDGYVLCADCARKAYEDPDEPDHEHIHAGEINQSVWHADTEDSSGLPCDHCGEYIIEPFCAECGTTEPDATLPVFREDACGIWLCGPCMAALVTKEDAHKTGKGTYTITAQYTHNAEYVADWAEDQYHERQREERRQGQHELCEEYIANLDAERRNRH